MTKTISPIEINGQRYYRPSDFAHLVNKSENTIYRLVNHGNAVRRMKCTYEYMGMPLIPEKELTAFPFTGSGRYALKEIYHYDENGVATLCDVCCGEGVGHCSNTAEEK